MAPLLQVERSTKRFGGLIANRDVSLAIEPGEIVGLIGPNGAGKTTLFNCISGALHPDEGRIVLDGADITHARPERVCRLGIARTWQVVRSEFDKMMLENAQANRVEVRQPCVVEQVAFVQRDHDRAARDARVRGDWAASRAHVERMEITLSGHPAIIAALNG